MSQYTSVSRNDISKIGNTPFATPFNVIVSQIKSVLSPIDNSFNHLKGIVGEYLGKSYHVKWTKPFKIYTAVYVGYWFDCTFKEHSSQPLYFRDKNGQMVESCYGERIASENILKISPKWFNYDQKMEKKS